MINTTITIKKSKTTGPFNQIKSCVKGMFLLMIILFNSSYVNAKSVQSKIENQDDLQEEEKDLNTKTILKSTDDTSEIEHLNTVNALNIKKIGNQVQLSWGLLPTKLESKFIVQRGIKGASFEDIAQLKTEQTNQITVQYGIVDPNLVSGEIYFYRLRHEFSTGESKVYDFIPVKINSDEVDSHSLGQLILE